MRSTEIRERFLRFFEARGHIRLPSASLLPHDDPSLLFTVAGMVPLKPYISGQRIPPGPNLCSCQKVFRGSGLKYDDISSVGDAYHHTFFEMLGNWSIGDYFKEQAIEYAWELCTTEFGLDPDRLWPSIYPDDAISERAWKERIGVPEQRIARLTDNWWAAADTGPCGFDSEIYWDFGPPCSCGRQQCTPQDECGGDRWCEIWNLVFMEFDQQPDGSRPLLPRPTVDTGMGLERMTSVLQNVRTDYANDLFLPLMERFMSRSAAPASESRDRSLRVLSDHVRGAAFLIAAGVLPGSEGRGYVLRRLIRRGAMHARRAQVDGGLAAGVPEVSESLGGVYPEIADNVRLIERIVADEEAGFARTIEQGSERLESLLGSGAPSIAGEDAFRLYDTYGVPFELTVEMAAERGIAVDAEGFGIEMERQRARSQAGGRRAAFTGAALPPTRFVGYDSLEADARVTHVGPGPTLTAGEEGELALDVSPFYAEAGGQVGDTGSLRWETGVAEVLDTQPLPGSDSRIHRVRVRQGTLTPGTTVHAAVDAERRSATARHHSATHLLNQALREVLGPGIVQRGSYVAPDHTTFDFSYPRALTPEELIEIEHRVNAAVRRNLERTATELPLPAARASGAIALLDEDYKDMVRVVDFGGWSRELCGGTHVGHSGDLGAAIIVGEASIGQGIRRITMVAGEAAERRWQQLAASLLTTARALKVRPDEVPLRVTGLQEQVRRHGKELEAARRHAADADGLASATLEDAGGIGFAHAMTDDTGARDLVDRLLAERLQGNGVAAAVGAQRIVVKAGGSALEAGIDAAALVREAAAATGGKGGGRREFAEGRLGDPARRHEALERIRAELLRRR